MKFEDLHTEATNDLKIDQFDLATEALKGSNLFSKWLKYLRDEKLLLKAAENSYNKLFKERWEYFRGKADDDVYKSEPQDKTILRQDVDVYLNADDKIIAASDKVAHHKEKVAYIEKVVKFIENRNFAIKAAIDWQRFTSGSLP